METKYKHTVTIKVSFYLFRAFDLLTVVRGYPNNKQIPVMNKIIIFANEAKSEC